GSGGGVGVGGWRDGLLAVTGTLDGRQGGPAAELGRADNLRRTLYGTVRRRELDDLLRLHDFPDPTTHSPARTPTTTPLQQLFVLNSPLMLRQAQALTRRLAAEAGPASAARFRRAYALLYGRTAPAAGARLDIEFLRAAPWEQYAQVLLATGEFAVID